jgi:hypothetical protein
MTRIHESIASTSAHHATAVLRSRASSRVRRVSSLIASVALAMTGVVFGAQGAQAASATPAALTMGSQCASWQEGIGANVVVTGDVGDTFTATKGALGTACFVYPYTISGTSGIVTTGDSSVSSAGTVFTIVGSGTFSIARNPMSTPQNLTITVVATAPAASAGPVATPEDVFQSVPLGSVSSCASITRPDLDWSGVAAGNWTQSWAMWSNGGTGGSVCNRVLWFDTNSSRWSSALR